jgi:thiamine biosynthesis lipoprotein
MRNIVGGLNSKFIQLLVLLIVTSQLSGCFPSNENAVEHEVLLQGFTMGTTYNIKVVVDKTRDVSSLKKAIDEKLIAVNQSMSTYIPDSELSLFNRSQSTDFIDISLELRKVMTEALHLGEISSGKLDVTVGPLVNLWGFGPDFRVEKMPTTEELLLAGGRVGLGFLTLTEQGLKKSKSDVYIDLSTIAKGYGVDVIAELIETNGIQRYLVEIGGEMRLKGFKANGTLWTVAVEKPMSNERAVQQLIVPKDNAMATSGDYRNYIEVDGIRYSHIIDPETGKPINHKLVSVTVIHPSSMTADGLSTAIMVMGEQQGLAFVKEHDIAAMLIVKTENGFEEINTVKFMSYLK